MRTKTYKITRGKHHTKGKTYEVGDTIELSPSQARSLVNKIAPVQAPAELFPEEPPAPPAEPTRDEMIAFLTEQEAEFDPETEDEEIKEAYEDAVDFANLEE